MRTTLPGVPVAPSAPDLASWRAKALQRILTTTAVAVVVAYVPGVWVAARDGVWGVVALDTAAWVVIVALAAGVRLGYRFRAVAFLVAWFAFSAALVVSIGPVGGGPVWLLATPVLATVLFGRRGGAWAVAAVLAFAVGYAAVLLTFGVPRIAGIPGGDYDAGTWAATAGSVVFLAILLVGAMVAVLEGMTDNAERLEAANAHLTAALADRERLEATLVATAKARSLGALAAGIAHDLNNLLVPLLVAGTAAREAAVDGRQRERLDLVVGAAERARELSRRILAFSRGADAGEPEPRPVAPLIAEVVDLVRTSAPGGVRVVSTIDPDAGAVRASAGELHQVAMNLCTNALHAVEPRGGTVHVRLHADPDGRHVRLDVTDDGAGMTPEHLEQAFEPYFTTRREGDGTGLGLAIVRHVVEGVGGRVSLASTPGAGTVATVRWPRADAVQARSSRP